MRAPLTFFASLSAATFLLLMVLIWRHNSYENIDDEYHNKR